MNLSAFTFRASEMRAGMASPAPPVVQPGPCGCGSKSVAYDSLPAAVAAMPARSPVEVIAEAMTPLPRSVSTFGRMLAYFLTLIISRRAFPAATVPGSVNFSAHWSEYAPPKVHIGPSNVQARLFTALYQPWAHLFSPTTLW